MFKSVEYTGFDGHPELKAKAEQLTPVLANEINTWRDDVEVRWQPPADPAHVLDLVLTLELSNGVAGNRKGSFTPEDFSRDAGLAGRCRRVWSALLGDLLDRLDARVQEALLETTEA